MEKITLKLSEFYALDAELNGLRNQQSGEALVNGLLQEKLPLVVKYWLTDLAKKVAAEKATIEELKNDIIKKHGTTDENGNISIPFLIDVKDEEGNPVKSTDAEGKEAVQKMINPAYTAFDKEFSELLNTEKELEYKAFKLEDFEKVETSENYVTFFKLISVKDEAAVVPMQPK